jgi:hypothetical protein
MTVSGSSISLARTFDGVTTAFAIPLSFQFIDAADLSLTLIDEDGAETIATIGSAGIALAGDGIAGTAVLTVPLPAQAGYASLRIDRETALKQDALFDANGAWPSKAAERALDRAMLALQEVAGRFARAILVPIGAVTPAGTPAAVAAWLESALLALLPSSFKGDPGGNVEASTAFQSLGGMTVPEGADAISTAEAHAGQLGGGGRYVLDADQTTLSALGDALVSYAAGQGVSTLASTAAVTALERRVRRPDAAGRIFQRDAAAGPVMASQVRLSADDDAGNLQALADLGSLFRRTILIDPRNYVIDEPIFVTHGKAVFTTNRFVGSGWGANPTGYVAAAGEPRIGGTVIVCTDPTKPGLIVQGGRGVLIADLHLTGAAKDDMEDAEIGSPGFAGDDSLAASWDITVAEKRWAPHAAIAFDPLNGDAPATPYPAMGATPGWFNADLYGRIATSRAEMKRISIEGFLVGIAVNPSNNLQQCDFVHGADFLIEYCKWGVSIGNTQARLNSYDQIHFSRVYCGFTNKAHGQQAGTVNAQISHASMANSIMLFDLSMTSGVTFQHPYIETGFKIGRLRQGGSGDHPCKISDCLFNFVGEVDFPRRGVPGYLIDAGPGAVENDTSPLVFEGGFINVTNVVTLATALNEFRGFTIKVATADSAAPDLARALAHNGSWGLLVARWRRPSRDLMKVNSLYNLDTLAVGGRAVADDELRRTSRVTCLPWWLRRATPRLAPDNRQAIELPRDVVEVAASDLTSVSVSGIEVTATGGDWLTQHNGRRGKYRVGPGSLVWVSNQEDGLFLYVAAVNYTTGVFTMKALCGYHDPVNATLTSPVLKSGWAGTTGNLLFFNNRFFTPSRAMIADFTSGSNVAANVRAMDGDTSFFAAGELAVGDFLWIDPEDPAPILPIATFSNDVTGIDFTARTITFRANALVTGTRRLELFVRNG